MTGFSVGRIREKKTGVVSTEFEPRDRQELADYYSDLLARHLLNPGEPTLQEAEQLGQSALKRSPSLREIAEVHHEALCAALGRLECANWERPAVFGSRAAGRESSVPGDNPPTLHAVARL